ncbi:cellulase family glycosylhydrolase [Deinococcus misasensis]|uniref:cellulase family glycosylhydrolase n=1 Tax=Deinococcus misasensis TaxID=392413 RepID=UPI00054E4E89|nr:cellulase family glycosylhydrolase [Deinococcus misasensis]
MNKMLGISIFSALFLASCGSLQSPSINQSIQSQATGGYVVQGANILDPMGKTFQVRGASVAYQTFIFNGQDHGGYDRANYLYLEPTLDDLKARGINLVRIFVTEPILTRTASWNNNQSYLTMLDRVIASANSRGMVALVTNSYRKYSSTNLAFVGKLAARYKDNPMVWLTPMNEPNCAGNTYDDIKCEDWANWKKEQNAYIGAIRNAQFKQPILINSISYSWDLTGVTSDKFKPTDPLQNLIYGAHCYGNEHLKWDAAQAADTDALWANLANTVPVVVDEVGADNGPGEFGNTFVNSLEWADGFMGYVENWINTRGGDGVIGFTSYTSDGNTLYQDAGYVKGNTPQPVLPLQPSLWGQIFFRHVKPPIQIY